jgi:hypothetical protein
MPITESRSLFFRVAIPVRPFIVPCSDEAGFSAEVSVNARLFRQTASKADEVSLFPRIFPCFPWQ